MRWLSRRFAWKEVCGVEPSEACCAENLCVGILGYVDLNNDLTKRPSSIQKASALGVAYIFQWVHDPNIRLYWTLTFTFIHYYINTSTLIGLPPCLPLQEPYYCTLAWTFMSISSMVPFIHHNYLLPSEWTSQRQKKINCVIYHAHLLFPRQGLAASCMMRLMSEIIYKEKN